MCRKTLSVLLPLSASARRPGGRGFGELRPPTSPPGPLSEAERGRKTKTQAPRSRPHPPPPPRNGEGEKDKDTSARSRPLHPAPSRSGEGRKNPLPRVADQHEAGPVVGVVVFQGRFFVRGLLDDAAPNPRPLPR